MCGLAHRRALKWTACAGTLFTVPHSPDAAITPWLRAGLRAVGRSLALSSHSQYVQNALTINVQKADHRERGDRKGVPKNKMYWDDRALRPSRLAMRTLWYPLYLYEYLRRQRKYRTFHRDATLIGSATLGSDDYSNVQRGVQTRFERGEGAEALHELCCVYVVGVCDWMGAPC